jgi:hypothetical protein
MFNRIKQQLWRTFAKDRLGEFTPRGAEALDTLRGNRLADIIRSDVTSVVDKWIHYLPIYDRYFSGRWRQPIRMLEIGVFRGGSLEMWRKYFGPDAVIFGIDINPDCAGLAKEAAQVRIGSQADADFVQSVAAEMGGIDIVLDDGSHVGDHQWASFDVLFPLLSEGGLYVVEDTHTSYWPEWGGGYGRKNTAIGLAKRLMDDQHAWYHNRAQRTPAKNSVGAIHVHDSIIVIEKQQRSRPVRFTLTTG